MTRSVPHHPELQGPAFTEPFQVRAGTVVLFRLGPGTLVIPAGGAGPGLDNLPEALIEHLQLYYSVRTPDALVTPGLSAVDLPAAKALVTAQALTSIGSAAARLHLAQWHTWRHVYFAHAGPHRMPEPDRQFPTHLWARPGDPRPLLPDGCTLAVHGHTITMSLREDAQPLPVMQNQPDGTTALYLDTGAFHTDVLTVLDLSDNEFHALTGHRRR